MTEDRSPSGTGVEQRLSRRRALQGLTAAGLFGLAGCSGDDGGDGGDGTGGSDGSGGTDGGDGGDGSDGGTTDTPTSEPIIIGLQADKTGPLSAYGFWHERVLKNYVDELNADVGIDGRQIELIVEDTATDSQQGIERFRALVQRDEADFVIGSQSSGVSIATNPLAKELQVPYFPLGEAPSITGSDGNRWVVRNNHDTEQQAEVAVQHGLGELGENWTIIFQDYAFGQQYRDAIQERLDPRGGTVVESIGVPVGETDLNSYLNQVPDDTEVLFNALIGGSSVNFLQQSSDLGVPGERLGAIASVEGIDIGGLGEGAEDAEYATMLPRELEEHPTDANTHLHEIADVEGTDEVPVGGHMSASYEALSWIKDAVEATGWSDADDHQSFIQWFEGGPSVEESTAYPQGPKYFRGEDHQCFMNMFVERIEGGQLRKVKEVEFDEPPYEPRANLAGQSF
jgi:ABC-type branched-subunit amino acid transport system substrate-binding protein